MFIIVHPNPAKNDSSKSVDFGKSILETIRIELKR